MILHDDIVRHRKFLIAAELLGPPYGLARALTLYVAAIGYARTQLTNGHVDDAWLTKDEHEVDAKSTAKVLGDRRVALFHRVRRGYRIHDFIDHNGSADKLKRQRKLARERQRQWRVNRAVENPVENNASRVLSRVTKRDRDASTETDTDIEKEKEVCTYADQGTYSPLTELRKKVHRLRRQRQKTDPADDGNFAVIERLAHVVMDESGLTDPADPELTDQLKTACATLSIDYGRTVDPDVVVRALTAAAHARLHGKRPS